MESGDRQAWAGGSEGGPRRKKLVGEQDAAT